MIFGEIRDGKVRIYPVWNLNSVEVGLLNNSLNVRIYPVWNLNDGTVTVSNRNYIR